MLPTKSAGYFFDAKFYSYDEYFKGSKERISKLSDEAHV